MPSRSCPSSSTAVSSTTTVRGGRSPTGGGRPAASRATRTAPSHVGLGQSCGLRSAGGLAAASGRGLGRRLPGTAVQEPNSGGDGRCRDDQQRHTVKPFHPFHPSIPPPAAPGARAAAALRSLSVSRSAASHPGCNDTIGKVQKASKGPGKCHNFAGKGGTLCVWRKTAAGAAGMVVRREAAPRGNHGEADPSRDTARTAAGLESRDPGGQRGGPGRVSPARRA